MPRQKPPPTILDQIDFAAIRDLAKVSITLTTPTANENLAASCLETHLPA
jgi:hypothetical protein